MTTVFTIADTPARKSCPTMSEIFAARVQAVDGKPLIKIIAADFDSAGRLPTAAYHAVDAVLNKHDGYVIVETPREGLSARANDFMSRRLLATAIGGQVDLSNKQRVFICPQNMQR